MLSHRSSCASEWGEPGVDLGLRNTGLCRPGAQPAPGIGGQWYPGYSDAGTGVINRCHFRMQIRLEQFRVWRIPAARKPGSAARLWQPCRPSGLPVILMDAPYRLKHLLEDVAFVFGKDQPVMLGCDLTLPGEKVIHGSIAGCNRPTAGKKCEYVLIVAGRRGEGSSGYRSKRSGKRRQ